MRLLLTTLLALVACQPNFDPILSRACDTSLDCDQGRCLDGYCTLSDDGATLDQACAADSDCASGQGCGALASDAPMRCRPRCGPKEPCPENHACWTPSSPQGLCYEGACQPLSTPDACPADGLQSCLPAGNALGLCQPTGELALGQSCALQGGSAFGQCAQNLTCAPFAAQNAGLCATLCRAFGPQDDAPTGCPAPQACVPLGTTWGACTSKTYDPPLAWGQPCGDPGFWCDEGVFCASIDDAPPACVPLCRVGWGDQDCPTPDLQCQPAFGPGLFGACLGGT
jgi:hypothetical protein